MQAPSRYLWGPLTAVGLGAAAIACILDQASKLWLLKGFDLANKGVVKLAPFVDLVLTWNTGISYGWFQQEGPFGQGALLALKVVAVALARRSAATRLLRSVDDLDEFREACDRTGGKLKSSDTNVQVNVGVANRTMDLSRLSPEQRETLRRIALDAQVEPPEPTHASPARNPEPDAD